MAELKPLTQREKLVGLLNKQKGYTLPIWTAPQTIEIMADALIANGVIVPPCKVGDTVYIIYPKQGIVERKIKRFQFGKYGLLAMVYGEGMNVDQLGTHFFLTKEAAIEAWNRRADNG